MSLPTLFLVGVTHRTAPFGFREKLALSAELEATLAADLGRLRSVREFAILNTCNRVEIYGVATDDEAARRVSGAFCSLRNIEPSDFDRFGFVLSGHEAVSHLLTVASGLDSQILGETEIFGQVKRAYATAQMRQSAGPILNRMFQKAFQAAKHVRTNTGVTTGQVSVANVGVDLALNVFGDVAEARILLIGAGEMGEKSAKAFNSRGTRHVTISSRHLERAEALAHDLGASAVAYDTREAQLADADIVVCSTASPDTVISVAAVHAAMAKRKSRPLLFIDLAMPRDVEAAVAGLENVFLYNLDDLARVAAENRQARQAHAEAGRQVLAPRTETLWAQLQQQMATLPTEQPTRSVDRPVTSPSLPLGSLA
jgi:glutamyl-tRNA reductase